MRKLTSQDNVIVELDGARYALLSGRLEAIEKEGREMYQELREIHAEIRTLNDELHMLATRVAGINDRINDMKFYVSLAFGALAVFVGIIALIPIVYKVVQVLRRPTLTLEETSTMINDAVSRALSGK